jgi:hypothetical protein
LVVGVAKGLVDMVLCLQHISALLLGELGAPSAKCRMTKWQRCADGTDVTVVDSKMYL